MDQDVTEAIAELQAQGIPVTVDRSGHQGDLFAATAPNGERYEFQADGLLKLKREGKLHLEGLQEMHLAKKELPSLSKKLEATPCTSGSGGSGSDRSAKG